MLDDVVDGLVRCDSFAEHGDEDQKQKEHSGQQRPRVKTSRAPPAAPTAIERHLSGGHTTPREPVFRSWRRRSLWLPSRIPPLPELVSADLEVAEKAAERLRPEASRRVAVDGHALTGTVPDLQLRRACALEVGAEMHQKVDQLAVLELRKRGQRRPLLDANELDVALRCLSRLFEKVRVALQQRTEVRLGLLLGRALRGGAHLRSEGDPAVVIGTLGRDRDVHCVLPGRRWGTA